MLHQLLKRGVEVRVLGATNFDHENGTKRFANQWEKLQEGKNKTILVRDGDLQHQLIKTRSTQRRKMSVEESDIFLLYYMHMLNDFKPDLVWFYGGGVLDRLIPYEARIRNIPSAAYLVNENYKSKDWCKDVDLIVTDTKSTSNYYKENFGFIPVPVGKFIPESEYLAKKHQRKNILFINPSIEKGAAIVASLAIIMEKTRPDIRFNVVQSRGDWQKIVQAASKSLGEERRDLSNVDVIPHTDDMRHIYEIARLLIVPSLWYESGARVIVEAMMNGIPVFATDRGGSPELMSGTGVLIKLEEQIYTAPYTKIPKRELLEPLVKKIEQYFDDQVMYAEKSMQARKAYEKFLSIEKSTDRLMQTFQPFFDMRSGDHDHQTLLKNHHKHQI
jgi:glycosyltransferase involved in cell wall biosynthesis